MNWEKLLNANRLRETTRTTGTDSRNEFESDFGRIIFSPAIRRMHDKTQVFPLTTDDNIHSRLTHSMEVMAIGYSLGIRLCENESFKKRVSIKEIELFRTIPIILKNSCLVHDIGNPPFGHFGETVIQNYFKNIFNENNFKLNEPQKNDFVEFDGNAQGLRVLTKLQILNDSYGLNLTCATLGAYIKYPNFGNIDKTKKVIESRKRGIFQSEIDYFTKIAESCETKIDARYIRHPLCYLMEAADSICYLTMDIEDGFNTGLYDLDLIVKSINNISVLKQGLDKILAHSHSYGDSVTKIVNIRIFLIQYLVDLSIKNFVENIDSIESGSYNKELILDDANNVASTLQDFSSRHIFPSRSITSLEITGHSVIKGLLEYYMDFIFHTDKNYRKRIRSLISNSIARFAFAEKDLPETSQIDDLDDYSKLRVIVDFISGMTDQFALNHFQKISGQKIN